MLKDNTMTLVEIRNEILAHFLNNYQFCLSKDGKKIKIGKGQEHIRDLLLVSILDDMAEDGLCNKIEDKDKDTLLVRDTYYVLAIPLGAQSQKVEISSQTAEAIHNLLTHYAKANNIKDYVVNKLEITNNEIQNVIMICSELLESLDKEDEEDD